MRETPRPSRLEVNRSAQAEAQVESGRPDEPQSQERRRFLKNIAMAAGGATITVHSVDKFTDIVRNLIVEPQQKRKELIDAGYSLLSEKELEAARESKEILFNRAVTGHTLSEPEMDKLFQADDTLRRAALLDEIPKAQADIKTPNLETKGVVYAAAAPIASIIAVNGMINHQISENETKNKKDSSTKPR